MQNSMITIELEIRCYAVCLEMNKIMSITKFYSKMLCIGNMML